MDYEERAMLETEDKYAFAQSQEVNMRTGLIGYLRADFGSGKAFYSSWWGFRDSLKTPAFVAEFDDVINALREEGDILHSLDAMRRYCWNNPQAKMGKQYSRDSCGVRIDTDEHTYFLRLTPIQGDYNLYCYCYKRKLLDSFIKKAAKGIRFIDSNYKELFRLPDDGKIVVHSPIDGDKEYPCRYIDDSHVEIGCYTSANIYHIAQFAEFMERKGCTYEPVVEIH